MRENEVIIVNQIPDDEYIEIVRKSVKYSLISTPFTVDRMKIPNITKRALNIAKGKIAENIFQYFCNANRININFDSCATPFWDIDLRDFILNNKEWDIKNNFIYHSSDELREYNYIDLPALVPNRFNGDQWSKRNEKLFNSTNGTCFLFTFLKNSDLVNGERQDEFLSIKISSEQQSFLNELYSEYKGQRQEKQPFDDDWFWGMMSTLGDSDYFKILFKPKLIITGYAEFEHFTKFKDTGPYDRQNNFQLNLNPRWYQKTNNGSLNFMKGTLWTKITNSTLPISELPSFLSLYPMLSEMMNLGKTKDNVSNG